MVFAIPEIARMFGVNEETVRRWIRQGKLEATCQARKTGYVVSEKSLERFLEQEPKYRSKLLRTAALQAKQTQQKAKSIDWKTMSSLENLTSKKKGKATITKSSSKQSAQPAQTPQPVQPTQSVQIPQPVQPTQSIQTPQPPQPATPSPEAMPSQPDEAAQPQPDPSDILDQTMEQLAIQALSNGLFPSGGLHYVPTGSIWSNILTAAIGAGLGAFLQGIGLVDIDGEEEDKSKENPGRKKK